MFEKEANEAHQQRVRFLAGQLASTERRASGETSLKEAQLAAIQSRLRQTQAGQETKETKEGEELRREYFQVVKVGCFFMIVCCL